MRAIAADLGVEAPSLYKHVANKDEILDGLCELVYGQVSITERHDHWSDRLRAYCHAFRTALLDNRHVAPLIATRPVVTEKSMTLVETALGEFAALGFDPEDARQVLNVTVSFVVGHALAEISTSGAEGVDGHLFRLQDRLPLDAFPLAAESVMTKAPDRDAEFALGIDLLIAGVRSLYGRLLDIDG